MANTDVRSRDTLASLVVTLIEQLRHELRTELLAELHRDQQGATWPEWMSVETAARYLDMPVERIRKLIARRAIPFAQEGSGCRIFFSRHDLDDWMQLWNR